MAKGVLLGERTVRAISKLLNPGTRRPGRRPRIEMEAEDSFWARLTEQDGTDLWKWGFEEVTQNEAGAWVVVPDGYEGSLGSEGYTFCIEVNEAEDAEVDQIVRLFRIDIIDTPAEEVARTIWGFSIAGSGGTLPTGEYPYMSYQTVSSNSNAFDFVRITPVFD